MRLKRKSFVFKPSGELEWSQTHAQVPFAYCLDDSTLRVFYSTRDKHSRSSVGVLDVDKQNPSKIKKVYDQPALSFGSQGSYDDSGTMPSWIVERGNELWLYYTAWNRSESASYRLSIGLAVSTDRGLTFQRKFAGPILDRSIHDPIWVGQPCVLNEDGQWKMWYLSCERIAVINDIPEPYYNVKYATSEDGINWSRENQICIDFDPKTDAIGRPCVWKHNDVYHMLHSNRLATDYRSNKESAYRIEHSVSKDGLNWKNEKRPLSKSETGWDSLMNEYCSIYPVSNEVYHILYNGNGFGASGFGYAELTLHELES